MGPTVAASTIHSGGFVYSVWSTSPVGTQTSSPSGPAPPGQHYWVVRLVIKNVQTDRPAPWLDTFGAVARLPASGTNCGLVLPSWYSTNCYPGLPMTQALGAGGVAYDTTGSSSGQQIPAGAEIDVVLTSVTAMSASVSPTSVQFLVTDGFSLRSGQMLNSTFVPLAICQSDQTCTPS
jgi:hypothetical protein